MPRIRHTLCCVSATIGCVLLVATAAAQEDKMRAEALFREGREALAKGDYASACELLSRSNDLDPAPGTQLNLGECEAVRGRVATAYFLFRRVEQHLDPNDIRAPIARSKREAAELRVPKLVIKLPDNAPPDSRVYMGGRIFTPEELREPLIVDPGIVEITVTASGHNNNTMRVLLEEAKITSVVIAPLPAPIVTTAPTHPQGPGASQPPLQQSRVYAPAPQRERSPTSKAGAAFLGVGIGSSLLGGVTGILTLGAKSTNSAHCDAITRSCDSVGRAAANRGEILSALTVAGLGIGAVGIGLGTYLLVRGGSDARTETSLRLQATASDSTLIFRQSF
jgi:hypothetical protein